MLDNMGIQSKLQYVALELGTEVGEMWMLSVQ